MVALAPSRVLGNLPDRAGDGNAGTGLAPGRTRICGAWPLGAGVRRPPSLVSHDARYAPNLGGRLGDGLARTLGTGPLVIRPMPLSRYLACLGRAVWAAPIRLLLRYTVGGAILLIALSTAGRVYKIPMVSPGGATARHDSRRVTW